MSCLFKHPLRVGLRMIWLGGELIWGAVNFVPRVLFHPRPASLEARAKWLHAGCLRVLRIFGAEIRSTGPIPTTGLLVSNHLSYFDVLVMSALGPSVFDAER